MIEPHSGIQQSLLRIIPFPFKVLLCLVVMHFTANSYSFEILCLLLISLLWEAALLHSYTAYFCLTAKLPLGMLIPHPSPTAATVVEQQSSYICSKTFRIYIYNLCYN